jgi:pyridoxamine 5'-phosphate oxidase
MAEIRDYLRSLTVFAGELPELDPDLAPEQPEPFFVGWLEEAVRAGVREPHAMTLSTLGVDGIPSGRVLILKNVDADGWQFAVHGSSPKGQDLIEHPSAALTFYWSLQARQVRVRGPVVAEPAERSAADFLARPVGSRAEALIGLQSRPLGDRQDLDLATKKNLERIAHEPDLVAPEWTLYTVRAEQVEFWQGDKERKHTRLRYTRTDAGWARELLWP